MTLIAVKATRDFGVHSAGDELLLDGGDREVQRHLRSGLLEHVPGRPPTRVRQDVAPPVEAPEVPKDIPTASPVKTKPPKTKPKPTKPQTKPTKGKAKAKDSK